MSDTIRNFVRRVESAGFRVDLDVDVEVRPHSVRSGGTIHRAVVYPSTFGTDTFGLRVHEHRGTDAVETWVGGRFCGGAWSCDTALDAALAWVERGAMPENG